MPTKKYLILIDGQIVDTSYSYQSFISRLNIFKQMYPSRNVTTEIINLNETK